jgi:hypothetical protein
MLKHTRISIAIVCILFFSAAFFVFQASAQTNYYSNDFESADALDDGYWSLHDAEIQAVEDSNVLVIDGEASFMPMQGNYALDNFTVQFDVYHNVVYENNTAYQGPFYEAADAEGNVVIRMGYVQKGVNDNLQQMGFVSFAAGPNGATYSHYYFPFDHSADWSTWRLTVVITKTQGPYIADATVQINGQTVTAFTNDTEQTLSSITNEEIYNPVSYHNLLPMPRAGAPVPTYAPTANSKGVQFDLLSNTMVKPAANSNGATPSYVDNFYYGYANALPTSAMPTINTGPEPANEPFPTTTAIALAILAIVVIGVGVLAYTRRSKRQQ